MERSARRCARKACAAGKKLFLKQNLVKIPFFQFAVQNILNLKKMAVRNARHAVLVLRVTLVTRLRTRTDQTVRLHNPDQIEQAYRFQVSRQAAAAARTARNAHQPGAAQPFQNFIDELLRQKLPLADFPGCGLPAARKGAQDPKRVIRFSCNQQNGSLPVFRFVSTPLYHFG